MFFDDVHVVSDAPALAVFTDVLPPVPALARAADDRLQPQVVPVHPDEVLREEFAYNHQLVAQFEAT